MDLTVLSRKISSYRTPKGRITKLPNELLAEILHAWEQWAGTPAGFYKQLGVDFRKNWILPVNSVYYTKLYITEESTLLSSSKLHFMPKIFFCSIERSWM